MIPYRTPKKLVVLCLLAGAFLYWVSVDTAQDEGSQAVPVRKDIIAVPGIPARQCDIRQYGAVAGENTLSTAAINAAISDCNAQGGGTVIIPTGKWLSGGIRLQSNIHLFLEEGSEISFSTNLQDYLPVVRTRFQGIEFYNYAPLIYTENSQNVAITGSGKLIGNGAARAEWTGGGDFATARANLYRMSREGVPVGERIFGDKEPGLRPSFIQFMNTKDILLDGFTVENGPIWTIHPVYSENFVARNLHIDTWSGNTDGIVIDSTKNVVIENSYFSTGDDAISIKSGLDDEGRMIARPSENIRIRNIMVEKGSSGVSIGSEMSGGIKDVDIRDSVFKNARHGFRIKSTKSRGGYIENVRVENIIMDDISGDVLDINLAYTSELGSNASYKSRVKDIVIRDIRGARAERLVVNVDSYSNPLMENVLFENIIFESSARGVGLKSAQNITLQNIQIASARGPSYEIENSQNISVVDSVCHGTADPCVLVQGSKTSMVSLENVSFLDPTRRVDVRDGARRGAVTIRDTR